MRRALALGFVLAATLTACGGSPSAPKTAPTIPAAPEPTTTTTTTAAVDPYAVYLAHNPDPTLVLTREDAQARAYLGCGTTWAPGTIDAALADAYRPGVCER